MNAVEAATLSSKRAYQLTSLELVGSSQSKRPTSFSVSAATVTTQVGVSSSVLAKPRNPGQREIIPVKHFDEYHGADKTTEIPPGALAISSKKPASSKSTVSQVSSVQAAQSSPPSNHGTIDHHRRSTMEFLIRWTGYEESSNSWEPYKALMHVGKLHIIYANIGCVP